MPIQPRPLDGEVEKFEVCTTVGSRGGLSFMFVAFIPRRGNETDEGRALQSELRRW